MKDVEFWKRTARMLAEDVLSLAEDGGMPDSYKETDSRMVRARKVLTEVREAEQREEAL